MSEMRFISIVECLFATSFGNLELKKIFLTLLFCNYYNLLRNETRVLHVKARTFKKNTWDVAFPLTHNTSARFFSFVNLEVTENFSGTNS